MEEDITIDTLLDLLNTDEYLSDEEDSGEDIYFLGEAVEIKKKERTNGARVGYQYIIIYRGRRGKKWDFNF